MNNSMKKEESSIVDIFYNLLLDIANEKSYDSKSYRILRDLIMDNYGSIDPKFVPTCISINQNAWSFELHLKDFKSHKERINYISTQLKSLIDYNQSVKDRIEIDSIKDKKLHEPFDIQDFINTPYAYYNSYVSFWYVVLTNKEGNLFQEIYIPFKILHNYISFYENYNKPIECLKSIDDDMKKYHLNDEKRLIIYDKLYKLILIGETINQDKFSIIKEGIIDRIKLIDKHTLYFVDDFNG
jgi:hypothetical protein